MNKPTPWFLRPLYSRGSYSPRLTAAWSTLLFTFWLIRRWITFEPKVMAGILLQSPQIGEVVGILIALVAALFGLGTLQKVRLDGPPPAPDTQVIADSAPVQADTVNLTTPANEQPQP